MLNLSAAAEIARTYVARSWEALPAPDAWELAAESTVERPWGWVFVFTSRTWRETNGMDFAVAGNVPLLVERSTANVIPLGTAQPIAHYVEAYEQRGDPHVGGEA